MQYRERYGLNTECNRPCLYVRAAALAAVQSSEAEPASSVCGRLLPAPAGRAASLASSKLAISQVILEGVRIFLAGLQNCMYRI